jgi:hypothetical protein
MCNGGAGIISATAQFAAQQGDTHEMIYRSTPAGAMTLPLPPLAKGLLATVLALLVAFWIPPWVLLDPIDRFTYLDGKARSMIPEVFAAGDSRSSVQLKLSASGYYHWPVDWADHHETTGCPDLACARAQQGYTDFYRKVAVTWSIACSHDFIVWLKFGEDDRLVSARNDIYSTCL